MRQYAHCPLREIGKRERKDTIIPESTRTSTNDKSDLSFAKKLWSLHHYW
jgi:hypothetical protein